MLSASCLEQGTSHPLSRVIPDQQWVTIGPLYMFRRDFKRLQAQRNQGFLKEPVSIKQGTMPPQKQVIPNTQEASELESQFSRDTDGAGAVEQEAVTSDGLGNLNLREQMSAYSDDGRLVGQVFLNVQTFILKVNALIYIS